MAPNIYRHAGPRRKARTILKKPTNFLKLYTSCLKTKVVKNAQYVWNSLGICSKSCCISRMTWRLLNRPRHRWQFVCKERPRGQALVVQRSYTKSVINLSLIINKTMKFQTRWQMKVECFPQLSNLWWMQNSASKGLIWPCHEKRSSIPFLSHNLDVSFKSGFLYFGIEPKMMGLTS